jgi:tetratricopeptide (TPR) repeat protein
VTFVVAFAVAVTTASAQQEPQALFEAGQYEQALAALGPELQAPAASVESHYLAVLIASRLDQPERAAASLAALASNPDHGWQLVSQSASALSHGDAGQAAELANQAVAANPPLFAAHYQLGLSRARAEDWAGAAAAFEHAIELNPTFAYASYYAGLSFSRVRRVDKTAEHFERFLRLAPAAPERTAVQSIMRTLRGR